MLHFFQKRQSCFPLPMLPTCTDGSTVRDDIRSNPNLLHFLQERQSCFPLSTISTGTDGSIVGDDIGSNPSMLHVLQDGESHLPLFVFGAYGNRCREVKFIFWMVGRCHLVQNFLDGPSRSRLLDFLQIGLANGQVIWLLGYLAGSGLPVVSGRKWLDVQGGGGCGSLWESVG